MSARLPRLNRLMVLEAVDRAPDGAGGFVEVRRVLGRLWAELDPRSGRESGEEEAPLGPVTCRITVRGAPPSSPRRPRPGQILREGTRVFRLLAISEADAGARFLTCYAREEEVSQ